MVVRVMVGGHQDPTGMLQVDLVEQHLGKWLMGGEERECGWRKLLANFFRRDHVQKGRHKICCTGERSYNEKMFEKLNKVCWSEQIWDIVS